jgi:alkanesulfonate monooxygenase SsuD/methylene tetrahydromethanopterin reductase-like flavin-dependent oxidoreductase (luciferase family)
VQKLARETVTLDHLSGGRLTLGVGLGNPSELARFGEVEDPRERAERLDQGLARLAQFWDGEFQPRPLQRPRIPVWAAAVWPHRRPVRRAIHWDGLFPIDLPGPDALAELAREINRDREGGLAGFDLVVEIPADQQASPWEQAGATWVLTEFGMQPRAADVHEAIEAGPQ